MKPVFESLENRQLLSAVVGRDGGETYNAASGLGKLSGSLVVNNSVSAGESSDFFRFSVRSQGNVNLTLAGLSTNANLRLFDANGRMVAASARTRSRSEAISRNLKRGDYTIAVDRGKRAGDTAYSLSLQADLNRQDVEIDGGTYTLALNRADRTTAPIAADRETWVVIHGWLSDPSGVHRLARALDASTRRDQVLELDWSDIAQDVNAVGVIFKVSDVAAWVKGKLSEWGIPGSRVNLVGHSMGGYMTDEIARRISGGVDRIVALDPAPPVAGGFDIANTNFAAHSRRSIAFFGSDYGNLGASRTADQTINVNVGTRSSLVTHSNVVTLFAGMTERNNSSRADRISPLFSLKVIGAGSGPFAKDGMGEGYEATLVGRSSDGSWYPRTLTYKDASSKKSVSVSA